MLVVALPDVTVQFLVAAKVSPASAKSTKRQTAYAAALLANLPFCCLNLFLLVRCDQICACFVDKMVGHARNFAPVLDHGGM